MSFKVKNLIGLIVVGATVSSANAASIIDDFTSGSQSLSQQGLGSVEDQATGTMIGGQRDLLLQNSFNPFNAGSTFEIDSSRGFARGSQGPSVSTNASLQYDGFDVEGNDGMQTASAGGLNKNFVADHENYLELTMLYCDRKVRIFITLENYTADGTVSVTQQVSFGGDTIQGNPQTKQIGLNSFTFQTQLDITDIDSMTFEIRGDPSADYVLGSIQTGYAVPEPASITAIFLGLAGLAARRRKRS